MIISYKLLSYQFNQSNKIKIKPNKLIKLQKIKIKPNKLIKLQKNNIINSNQKYNN